MHKTIIRQKKAEGGEVECLQDWVWPEVDYGVWDGPAIDWNTSHSKTWFEHVKKYDVCIQAGGACGMYPRLLAQKFKVVYTFEPHPLSFYCLVQNCPQENIIKINGALGEHHAMINNNIDVNGSTNLGTNQVNKQTGAFVPQFRIDDLVLENCDLIALDVEGYEANILKGGLSIIQGCRPVIVMENGARQEIKNILEPEGYKQVSSSVSDVIWIPM